LLLHGKRSTIKNAIGMVAGQQRLQVDIVQLDGNAVEPAQAIGEGRRSRRAAWRTCERAGSESSPIPASKKVGGGLRWYRAKNRLISL
jgi:hypothetical protein